MTSEQERYIEGHWNGMSCESLRKQFNSVFGTSYKSTAFHYHTKRLGLSKCIVHKYTPEQDEFLRANSGKLTRSELTELFNKIYGTQIKEDAITMRCWQRGWSASSDGRFKNGDVPWCKTKGGREEYVKKLKGGNSHSFHKGIVPFNTKEVGTVSHRSDGIYIKTAHGFVAKPRYIWEKNHGKIPKGYVILSVDGDKTTDDVCKLRCISNRTLTRLMHNRWCGKGEVIVDTGIACCKLEEILNDSIEDRQ